MPSEAQEEDLLTQAYFDSNNLPGREQQKMETDLTLYSYYRSSASYRVRIAMNLKGLDYQIHPVHLLEDGGQQYKPNYRSLNPMSQVPTLIHRGNSVSQSVAIIDYLDQLYPERPLYPKEPSIRARCIQLVEIINSGIQPIQNLSVLQQLEEDFDASATKKKAWIQHWVGKGLAAIESILEDTAGTYCFGGGVTAADVFLIPQVFSGARFGVAVDDYPIVRRVYEACMDLEAFQNAAPERQPDAPRP